VACSSFSYIYAFAFLGKEKEKEYSLSEENGEKKIELARAATENVGCTDCASLQQ
jgi:hypothetical protein